MSEDQKAAPTWRVTGPHSVGVREVNWTEIYARRDQHGATLTITAPGRPPMSWTIPSEAADILSAQLAPRCLLVVDTPSRAAMAQRLMPGWMVTHLCGALTGHHFPLIVVAAQPVRECDRAWLSEFLPTKLDVGGTILFTEVPGQRTRGEVPSGAKEAITDDQVRAYLKAMTPFGVEPGSRSFDDPLAGVRRNLEVAAKILRKDQVGEDR